MRARPLKQIYIRSRDCRSLEQNDARLENARRLFRAVLATGGDVRCATCDRRVQALTGAYFVILATPTGSETLAIACSDICLRRAKTQGVE
jgi:hypothetical protein